MKKTYWVVIPILILVIAAGVFGTRMKTDLASEPSQPSLPPTQMAVQAPSQPGASTNQMATQAPSQAMAM